MRKILRQAGISSGVQVVYSTEGHRELNPAASSACGSECICPNKGDQVFSCEHRRVILGSISYLPPLFGLMMAGVVVNRLLEGNN
jgi:tRNA A37 threonylcarbamoyladenosine dehydratase